MKKLSQEIIDKLLVEITEDNLDYWNRAYLEFREYHITDNLPMYVWNDASEMSNPELYFIHGMPGVTINIGTTVDKCMELIEDVFNTTIVTEVEDEEPTDILQDCYDKMNPNGDYNIYVPFINGSEIKQVDRTVFILRTSDGVFMLPSLDIEEIDKELTIYETFISKIKWVDVVNFLHAKGND